MGAVDRGLPTLAAMAMKQEGGLKYLDELRTRFLKFVPAERAAVSSDVGGGETGRKRGAVARRLHTEPVEFVSS